ncbi:DUF1345 domain-containing protein [Rhodopseudomonas boonkerdii]|uniref:DUF1345 domain-containing protein n=1 Tax=Rhodopseudomonas boonkerdii TaxID=475937 RepID=UPI001E4C667F|nr:DUF1345 domain-containing protein [Rhodopseudomonas boonkerdii]UGV28201.1 DUF1345 domain-containing protein [Rhodopseudomonas boonkerdii]
MAETGRDLDDLLARFRTMPLAYRLVYGRPRTFAALAVGIVVCLLLPSSLRMVTRLLIGWDTFIAIYLLLVYGMMMRGGSKHIRRNAALQDDGSFVILMVAAFGAFASIAAIVFELGASKNTAELALAVITIAASWAAVHTTFSLHYAHQFYRGPKPGGLAFPAGDTPEHPDYWDFVYFAFVIGMTAQTSDVGITDKSIRRTTTAHGIVSFIFNTALVALMVNIAASAI